MTINWEAGYDDRGCFCNEHEEECGCDHCHEHKAHNWGDWNVRPIPCDYCQQEKDANDTGC